MNRPSRWRSARIWIARSEPSSEIVCAGDTTLESGPVLAYGHSIERGRFNCESQEAGMRCVNKRNGHGFFLSKQHYELF